MKVNKLCIALIALMSMSASIANAQESRERDRARYDPDYDDVYEYCRERAMDITGYYGPVPKRHRDTNVLEESIKGAMGGAAIGWIGGNDAKKAAKRGAFVGLIAGAIKKGKEQDKRRANDRLRREYQFEMKACMRAKLKDE